MGHTSPHAPDCTQTDSSIIYMGTEIQSVEHATVDIAHLDQTRDLLDKSPTLTARGQFYVCQCAMRVLF